MNSQLQQKIKQHRQRKNMKKTFDQSIEEKKKKLKQLTNDGQQFNDRISNEKNINVKNSNIKSSADSFMDFKHRRYIQITKQLMEAKSKLTEINHQCEDMKTEVFFEQKKLSQLREHLKRQEEQQQQMVEKKIKKFEEQKKQKIKMYEDRISKNIEHIEQLLKQKQEQNQRKMKFVEKKKKFEEVRKKMKQKYEEQLKTNKQKWAEQQKQKREQWEKSKMEDIEGRTLRNLEPEIQRIVQRSKDEINKIRQKYEGMMEQFRKAADEQFEKSVKGSRQIQGSQLEQERSTIIEENNKKLRQQAEQLEMQFEEERIKAKNDYNEEIKHLEHNRRVQSEQYIRKNRYFYVENLQQIKKIKDQYEVKIRELDGVLMKQVDERQAMLVERNRTKIQAFKQAQRLKLKKRMEEYDRQIKSAIENSVQKLSSDIAIQNAGYERKLAKQCQQKIRQEKQNSEVQVKQIKKSIVAIQSKIEGLKRQNEKSKQERGDYETTYLQGKQQNEYLSKKLLQISAEVESLKVSESGIEGRKNERKVEVENMWERQIDSVKQTLHRVQQQIRTTVSVMKQRQKQAIRQTEQAIEQIQKHSNKIIKQKQVQEEGLLIKIEHEQKQRESLKSILRQQLQLMKNYNIK